MVATAAPAAGLNAAVAETSQANNTAKVSEAQSKVRGVPIPGMKARGDSRREASAASSNSAMRAFAEAKGSGGQAQPAVQTKQTPSTPAATTGTTERPRDTAGRFAPKAAATSPAPAAATGAAPEATEPAEGKPGAKPEDAWPAEAKQRVATLEKTHSEELTRLRAGSEQANTQIADLTDERDHHKTRYERLVAAVANLVVNVPANHVPGTPLRVSLRPDPLEDAIAERDLKLRRAERGDKQRTQQQVAQQTAQLTETIKGRMSAILAKHPELDTKSNPEARQWWDARLHVSQTLDTLEQDAASAALYFRTKQVAAHQQAQTAAQPQKPQARARPAAMIPSAGAESGGAIAVPVDKSGRRDVSNRAMHEHMSGFRAIKGGRG